MKKKFKDGGFLTPAEEWAAASFAKFPSEDWRRELDWFRRNNSEEAADRVHQEIERLVKITKK